MIIWIASYPKSGNTWIRSLLASYFFSKEAKFNFSLLDNIEQFSSNNLKFKSDENLHYQDRISKNWIPAQELINKDKKIHFLKTHNAICKINNNNFTDNKNTLAAIYIVRDPRNIINSLSHHYEFSQKKAYDFLTNKRKIIFPINSSSRKLDKNEEDFNFLSDWATHYETWKNINFCKIKIIKYEDILFNTEKTFISTLKFLSEFINIDLIDKKIKNALKTTTFAKLKSMEKKHGFKESVLSTKTNKKISFFNLGKKNNWRKNLDRDLIKKIENKFKKQLKELKYL